MALFNSSMFGSSGGLLSGLGAYIPQDIKDAGQYLWELDRATSGNPLTGKQTFGLNAPPPQPDTFDQRFGAFQQPTQVPAQAPQIQPPAQAMPAPSAPAAAPVDAPNSAYKMGGVDVPVYGQAPEQPQVSAQRRGAAVAGAVTGPVAPSTNPADAYYEFFDRFSPGYSERRSAKQTQTESAKNLFGVFKSRGMDDAQAANLAMYAAKNPKVAEELLKPYANMEQRIANRPGTAAPKEYTDFIRDKNAAEKAGTVQGESQATAQINLQGTKADVDQTMQTIKELRNHKGRKSIGWHGVSANIPDDMLKGTEAYGAVKLQDRLLARTFTDQVKTMVGMGALSNAEGAKIADAVASLSRGLKEAEYDKALDFIEGALRNGIDKMSTKAGGDAPYGFKGGNIRTLPGGITIEKM